MDYKDVTLEDIERMENELRHYYSMRKMFLGIGWGINRFIHHPFLFSSIYRGIYRSIKSKDYISYELFSFFLLCRRNHYFYLKRRFIQ